MKTIITIRTYKEEDLNLGKFKIYLKDINNNKNIEMKYYPCLDCWGEQELDYGMFSSQIKECEGVYFLKEWDNNDGWLFTLFIVKKNEDYVDGLHMDILHAECKEDFKEIKKYLNKSEIIFIERRINIKNLQKVLRY